MTIAKTVNVRARRTQAERTEETRGALIEAAIRVLHRSGYNAATTAAIADEAGVSRGSIIYQFGTRAQLMSDVISFVYEYEQSQYDDMRKSGFDPAKTEDWPEMLWRVFSQPSGIAVIEILQASRSDAELAALVGPTQERVEDMSIERMSLLYPGEEKEMRSMVRLLVWATRGLALAHVLVSDQAETERSVRMFRSIVKTAIKHRD